MNRLTAINKRRLLVFAVDVILIALAYVASFLLRFDFTIPVDEHALFVQGFWLVLVIKPLVFFVSGLYKSLWRYASLQDAVEIFKAVTISSIFSIFAVLYLRHFAPIPRSIFILDWMLLFFLIAASRLIWRVIRETYLFPKGGGGKRTVIVGAGEAGNLLVKEIRRQSDGGYDLLGFLDDDPAKRGMRLQGLPIFGAIDQLVEVVERFCVEELIIAIPSASGRVIREIMERCKICKVRVKTLPNISAIIDGTVSVSQIKDVDIEDLLGREPVMLDEMAIRSYLSGKRVLVTGAAGSIGSEICRQVSRFHPQKLILFDTAETPLFYLEKELVASFPDQRLIPVIGDIRNKQRLELLFDEFNPEVVFHAAAYKHVPMMEFNPAEAVSNNVEGTMILADVSQTFGVKNFVMVSTDKAVNPTNVMGATKRAAEMYVQALAAEGGQTRFTTVRFGNVLGSNGSVIPIFKEQIRRGGPITVTDPEVVRYFMTIPEASQLVLQAGCIGNGGEIFLLDMGEPVKIVQLAEELIRLSGLTPYEDVEIVFVGLRPGEKLYEELLIEGEGVRPTCHDKIKVLAAVGQNSAAVAEQLEKLRGVSKMGDLVALMAQLKVVVPEFIPKYSLDGLVSPSFKRVRHDLFPGQSTNKPKSLLN